MEKVNGSRVFDSRNGGVINFVDSAPKMARSNSMEHNRKISDSLKGQPKSPETKIKMQASARKRWNRINAALAKV